MYSLSSLALNVLENLLKMKPIDVSGAVLHAHDSAITSIDWVIQNLTYWENLYVCYVDTVPVFRLETEV